MDRKFLVMVAAIAGLTALGALAILPIVSDVHAVQQSVGCFLLLFVWFGGGFATILWWNLHGRIGVDEHTCRILSFVGFKLAGFFFLALMIAGTGGPGWAFGFWLAFLASAVGAFAIYLTFNPALAQRLADAAKEKTAPKDEPADAAADEPASDDV